MKKIFSLLFLLASFNLFAQSKEQSIHLKEIEVNAEKANLHPGLSRVVTVIDQQEIQKMPVKKPLKYPLNAQNEYLHLALSLLLDET